MFNPSPEQDAFFHHLLTTCDNIMLGACAGSGKTTTIVEALSRLPKVLKDSFLPPSVTFLAFNKSIASTLRARCPRNVDCCTMHALGRRALVNSGRFAPHDIRRKDFVKGNKVSKRIYDALGQSPDIRDAVRLLSLARSRPVRVEEMSDTYFRELCDLQQFSFEEPQEVFNTIRRSITSGMQDLSCIDYDEMLWLPVVWDLAFDKQDYVFVDEAQDTNSVQLSILERLAKPKQDQHEWKNDGFCRWCYNTHRTDVTQKACWPRPSPTRYVFVGDPHQAIYGFRGANSDSMNIIAERFGCVKMPLSVSFRCPRLGVAESRKFLGQQFQEDIKPHNSALDGKVEHLASYDATQFRPGSAILCRTNAPLVAFAYSLLKRDIPVIVIGKDFGAQLAAVVKKMRATTLEDCEERLAKYFTREISKCADEDRNPDRLYDQQDCLRFFIASLDEDSRTVESLLAKIDLMFGEPDRDGKFDPRKVILSSIHRSKGLEFPTVFFLDRGLLPSKYATQPWQSAQEKNLGYVATTRWQKELYYINSNNWKQE